MVKRLVWAVGIVAAVVVLASVGLAAYVARTWDRVCEAPLPDVRISTDPAVLARGEYLVYGPGHCVECHGGSFDSLQNLSEGVLVPLCGGLRIAMGPLGAVYSSNLIPDPETGIGRYSDAQIAGMMRWAVRPNGRATAQPLMPFDNMGEDDLAAIISYLRAQPPVRNAVPANEWTMLGKVIKSFVGVMKPRSTINPPGTGAAPGGDEGAGRVSRALRGQLRRLPYTARSEHVCRDGSRFLRWVRDGADGYPRRRSGHLA